MIRFSEQNNYEWSGTDVLDPMEPFLLTVKRGSNSFIFINNGDGSTTSLAYPRDNSLLEELGHIQRVVLHKTKKGAVIQVISADSNGYYAFLIGEEPNPNPVVAKLYLPLKKRKFLMVTIVEFKDKKRNINFRSLFSDAKDFFYSEVISTLAELTPSYEDLKNALENCTEEYLLQDGRRG